MAFAAASAISALPRPPRVHSSPVAMASVSALSRPPRFPPTPIASASPLPIRALHRLPPAAAAAAVATTPTLSGWTSVPVSGKRPANVDESTYLITLDLTCAPLLYRSFTTPGQYVLARVHGGKPASMSICSSPRSGAPQFELLVKSVPSTTAEQLCNLKVGERVYLGPCLGQGFSHPIKNINPPQAAETVLLFAVAEGISPIRSLIKYGFAAKERDNVTLYYGARSQAAMPLRDEIKEWEKTGVKVKEVIYEQDQFPFLGAPEDIIQNPQSTAAILVGPRPMEDEVIGVLTDFHVPHDQILTYMGWYPDY